MLKQFRNLFPALIILTFSSVVLANDAPEAKAKDSASESYSGTQSDEWIKMEAELNALKGKLDAQQGIVQGLLPHPKAAAGGEHKPPPPPAGPQKSMQEKLAELNQESAKYQEMSEEYNKKLKEFQSRYPEKGQALGRKYQRSKGSESNHEGQSSEKPLDLDGRIKQLNQKIKSQYKNESAESAKPPVKKTNEKKHNNSRNHDSQSKPQKSPANPRKDVTEKIIIVK